MTSRNAIRLMIVFRVLLVNFERRVRFALAGKRADNREEATAPDGSRPAARRYCSVGYGGGPGKRWTLTDLHTRNDDSRARPARTFATKRHEPHRSRGKCGVALRKSGSPAAGSIRGTRNSRRRARPAGEV